MVAVVEEQRQCVVLVVCYAPPALPLGVMGDTLLEWRGNAWKSTANERNITLRNMY